MEQLDATDALLIEQEAHGYPQHVSPVLIYDASTAPQGQVRFRDIVAAFRHSLDKSAVFRRRLLRAPMNLDQPYWVEDEHFDLDYHLRHIALPKPGTWQQFCRLLGRLHAVPLDMSKPLWEAYVIDGLDAMEHQPRGSFALLLKVHSSAIHGNDLRQLINALQHLDPGLPSYPELSSWRPAPAPKLLHKLSRLYLNNLKRSSQMLKEPHPLKAVHWRDLRRASKPAATESGAELGTEPSEAPTEPALALLSGNVGDERVTDQLAIPDASLSGITEAMPGVSLTNIIATVIGGALQQYLLSKGELPSGELSLALLASVSAIGRSHHQPQPLVQGDVALGMHASDPMRRLEASMTETSATTTLTSLWSSSATMMTQPAAAVFSSTAANPPAHYLAGAQLDKLMIMPPLLQRLGLTHSSVRHEHGTSLMFVACSTMLPDPDFYLSCLTESLQQLRSAAAQHCSDPESDEPQY